MATKRLSVYIEGWTCSGCEKDNLDVYADKCAHCGKPFDDTKDHCWDEEKEADFPAKWVICGDCQGEGTTYLGWAAKDQPAFTAEDFDYEGPDFYEDYMSGHYDRECPECHGQGKVLEIEPDKCKGELAILLKEHNEALRASAEIDAEMVEDHG